MSHLLPRLARLSTLAAIVFATACGDEAVDVAPDAAPTPPPVRYEILHTRWMGAGPELALGSLDGKTLPLRALDGGVAGASQVALSPDGRKMAFTSFDATSASWALIVRPLEGAAADEVVVAHDATRPAWSPDGSKLAYVSSSPAGRGVSVVAATGGAPSLLARADGRDDCIAPQWSPDGVELVYATGTGLAIVTVAGGVERTLVAPGTALWTCQPRWSPDGSAIAFAWGAAEGPGSIRRIARAGGESIAVAPMTGGMPAGQVRWSNDGKRLAFVDFDNDASDAALRVVSAEGGTPVVLDHLASGVASGRPTWSADDQTLLYVRFDGGATLATVPAAGGTRKTLGLPGASIDGTYPTWLVTPIVR